MISIRQDVWFERLWHLLLMVLREIAKRDLLQNVICCPLFFFFFFSLKRYFLLWANGLTLTARFHFSVAPSPSFRLLYCLVIKTGLRYNVECRWLYTLQKRTIGNPSPLYFKMKKKLIESFFLFFSEIIHWFWLRSKAILRLKTVTMFGLPKLSHIILTAVGIYFAMSLWTFYQLFTLPPPPCQSGICIAPWLARDPKLELHLYTTTRKPSHSSRIPFYFRYVTWKQRAVGWNCLKSTHSFHRQKSLSHELLSEWALWANGASIS